MYQRVMDDDSSGDSDSNSSSSNSSSEDAICEAFSAQKEGIRTTVRGNAATKDSGNSDSGETGVEKSADKNPQGNISPSAEGESIPNSVDAEATPSDSADNGSDE